MSDEIICSECGRPNLAEADLCWYCQNPLGNTEPKQDDSDLSEIDKSGQMDDSEADADSPMSEKFEEDIPEWLKKVRALKKADQAEEDDEDQWRQEKLFIAPGEEKKQKTQRKSEPRNVTKPHTEKQKSSPESKSRLVLDQLDKSEKENQFEAINIQDDENPSSENQDELPDGFTPLDIKKG